ncbi:MAG: GUN4 domain-containing protein [Okeania sp. SIO2G4]|uniref:GUN4 domain-containing protein n=1 Tax=unclassified Okeania TaxID=2634635 RepID=UPI0013B818BD|nr:MULTISPECIES: GUN4 domain-containing protein [unclassified Okeania]NEP04416.1 GUN4 domain-containing protein [Okeania sp. SIO4D6]NEP39281.1 GUN4 domain-containing protein [Okeania sp. SIO2H7]NEP75823.1 GUN4 domain-containing protein [Okeania sp. SIO2G5]NEP96999.1 GUN4 domain-containing protein [Okeania sp. SIO2F5]NEQ94650.1 GUN4 domain-containing protein [Okeania sp. SIO2G4]
MPALIAIFIFYQVVAFKDTSKFGIYKVYSLSIFREIDQLWIKYSDGKFGFSVQKKIYQSLLGRKESYKELWEAFGNEVGWRKGGKWLYYSDLTFSLDTHYIGHLPVGTLDRLSSLEISVPPWYSGDWEQFDLFFRA